MNVLLSTETHFEDLTRYLHRNQSDITIIGKNGELTRVSSLVIMMASDYVKELIFLTIRRDHTKRVTIYLPDYNMDSITLFLNYITMGFVNCNGKELYDEVRQLIDEFQIKPANQTSITSIKSDSNIIKSELNRSSELSKEDPTVLTEFPMMLMIWKNQWRSSIAS